MPGKFAASTLPTPAWGCAGPEPPRVVASLSLPSPCWGGRGGGRIGPSDPGCWGWGRTSGCVQGLRRHAGDQPSARRRYQDGDHPLN